MFDAAQKVSGLRSYGVELSADGGRLKVRGPCEAMTPELREWLTAHKAGLLWHLKHRGTAQ